MYYARRWVGLEVKLADRMHFGSDAEPLLALARHAGPADSLAVAWLLAAHRRAPAAHRPRRGAPLGPRHRHHPHPAPVVLRAVARAAPARTGSPA